MAWRLGLIAGALAATWDHEVTLRTEAVLCSQDGEWDVRFCICDDSERAVIPAQDIF